MLKVVGQRLHIRDQDVGIVLVLQPYAVLQRAHIMAEMKLSGRSVPVKIR